MSNYEELIRPEFEVQCKKLGRGIERGTHFGEYASLPTYDAWEELKLAATPLLAALEEKDQEIARLLELVDKYTDYGTQQRLRAEAAEQRLQQPALADVMAERQRQVSAEGWTSGHDDTHVNGELALAAAEYAIQAAVAPWDDDVEYTDHESGNYWPWEVTCWKPTNQRRDLVKAGALILAEIDRLDRAAAKVEGE